MEPYKNIWLDTLRCARRCMSKSHVRGLGSTLSRAHSFPFRPALITFLYLTFKVHELGISMNSVKSRYVRLSHPGLFCLGSICSQDRTRSRLLTSHPHSIHPPRFFNLSCETRVLRFIKLSRSQWVNLGKCCAQDMRCGEKDRRW